MSTTKPTRTGAQRVDGAAVSVAPGSNGSVANVLRQNASEDDLLKYVTDLLRVYQWTFHHAGDSRRSTAGLPDIVAVRARPGYPGRVLFAELKASKGRLRDQQYIWLAELENCPQVESYVWRPADLDAIAEVLK
jgi:hypothetical protein